MKNGWYYRAAKNDIALAKEAINWKDVRKGLGWGAGLGAVPLAVGLMTGPHGKPQAEQSQKPAITQQIPANTTKQPVATPSPKTEQPKPQPAKAEQPRPQPQTATKTQPAKTSPTKNHADLDRIMNVIHQLESSGGINSKARFEPEFLKNYGDKGLMPTLRKRYGDKAAASSYGPYQVMLLKAWEMGFKVSPEELADPETNRKVAESIVVSYLDKGYKPWQVFKRYNGGDEYADRAINLLEESK